MYKLCIGLKSLKNTYFTSLCKFHLSLFFSLLLVTNFNFQSQICSRKGKIENVGHIMLDLLFMKGFYGKLILDKIEKLQNVALIGIWNQF
jgi:hypothetical protein